MDTAQARPTRNWRLFVHKQSFQVYAVSPRHFPHYAHVLEHYWVIEGLAQAEAEEDTFRSLRGQD